MLPALSSAQEAGPAGLLPASGLWGFGPRMTRSFWRLPWPEGGSLSSKKTKPNQNEIKHTKNQNKKPPNTNQKKPWKHGVAQTASGQPQ